MDRRIPGFLRPILALVVFVALVAGARFALWGWMLTWGTTPSEAASSQPIDRIYPDTKFRATLAVTIDAPPERVFPWLVQIGEDKAAFYSNGWAENLTLVDYRNGDRIVPAWQNVHVGDLVRSVPRGYAGGLFERNHVTPGWIVRELVPDKSFVIDFGGWSLEPVDGGRRTRVIARMPYGQAGSDATFEGAIGYPIHFGMAKRMLLGIKERVEGVPFVPRWLEFLAAVGWIVMVVAVAASSLAVSRLKRLWLLPGLIWAASILSASRDVASAAAAFLAIGIPIAAAYLAPRGWRLVAALGMLFLMMLIWVLVPDPWTGYGIVGLAGSAALGIASLRARRPARGAAAA